MYGPLNKNIRRVGLLFSILLIPIAARFTYGVFYEEYEPLFTLLISGKLTPGTTYDNLYYMAHIGGLSHIYSYLYSLYPDIQWLNWVNWIYMIVALAILVWLCSTTAPKYSIPLALFIASIIAENFMLFNMTRTSFMVCFSALFAISRINPPYKWAKLIAMYTFFGIGLFTRIESGVFAAVLFVGMSPLIISRQDFFKKMALLLLPAVLAVASMGWVANDISHSHEFYKQIEPDAEYELAVKRNYIPIAEMKTTRDSLRYQAIISEGIWGDAKTNDAAFIRSLINPAHAGMLSLQNKTSFLNPMVVMFDSRTSLFVIHLIIFLATTALFILYDPKMVWKPLLGEAFFIIFIWFVGYQLKLAERVYVPLVYISTIILLFASAGKLQSAPKYAPSIFFVLAIGLCIYHFIDLKRIANTYSQNLVINSSNWQRIREATDGHILVLNGESIGYLLFSQHPFENYQLPTKKIYIYNTLALNTIRPYKDFLEKECSCDAGDYNAFLTFIKNLPSPKPVFVMSEKHKIFMETYMRSVHQLIISWSEFPMAKLAHPDSDLMAGTELSDVRAYTINP